LVFLQKIEARASQRIHSLSDMVRGNKDDLSNKVAGIQSLSLIFCADMKAWNV
jgi:hypothetical protein